MEEILASIRRIISDEETVVRPAALARPAIRQPETQPIAEPNWEPEEAVEEADTDEPEAAFEAAPAEPEYEAPPTDDPAINVAEAEAELPPADEPHPLTSRSTAAASQLLSPGPDALVTAAFNQLANTILASQARSLEDLVQDMLRPMLRGWLDNNLPPLVERLVREEIERVSRGKRR